MRLTARAIIFNKKTGKILLINYLNENANSTKEFTKGFWALPGGGLEDNESFEEGLKREIYEETGLINFELKNCVLSRVVYLDIEKGKQPFYERYYLVKTSSEEIKIEGLTDYEINVIKEYKWWTIEEIKKTKEVIFPIGLKTVIDKAVKNSEEPIDITNLEDILKSI